MSLPKSPQTIIPIKQKMENSVCLLAGAKQLHLSRDGSCFVSANREGMRRERGVSLGSSIPLGSSVTPSSQCESSLCDLCPVCVYPTGQKCVSSMFKPFVP